MSWDDDPAGQVDGVEYLELPSVRVARIGQVAVGVVTGERDQARGVGRGVSDSVDHLHVSDVVDVEGLLQTHHQALVIERQVRCMTRRYYMLVLPICSS